MEPRLCTLAVPVRDIAGHYVAASTSSCREARDGAEMAERFLHPLQTPRPSSARCSFPELPRG